MSATPSTIEECITWDNTDYHISSCQSTNHIITEMTIGLREDPAIAMASDDGAVKMLKGLPEALLCQVGCVENHTYAFHFCEQCFASRSERAGHMCATAIACTLPGKPDNA